jgi:alkylhydroperoxidase/carboxymuconolactone decarboxylase family protein YurZ
MATPSLTPLEYLTKVNSGAADAFQALRKAVMSAGPLDAHTCELITLGAFVTAGNESSFKTHGRRLLKGGVSLDALRHAVLVTFAATATFGQVISSLKWIDDLGAEGK